MVTTKCRITSYNVCYTKLLRMNLKALLLLFFLIGMSLLLHAQDDRITAHYKSVSLKRVFELIQEQSEYIIFYNDSQVDLSRKVKLDVDDQPVDQILQRALWGTGLSFKIFDRQIIILKDQERDGSLNSGSGIEFGQKIIEGNVTDESGNPLVGVSVVVPGTNIGVTTEWNGHYSLKIPEDTPFLSFSFVGMKTVQGNVTGKNVFVV